MDWVNNVSPPAGNKVQDLEDFAYHPEA